MSTADAAASATVAHAVHPIVTLCGTLAPFASILVFAAPLPTIRQVVRDRGVGNLPLLPYTSMIASATLWSTYGVLKDEPKIWTSNIIGCLLGLYYFFNFIRFSPKSSPTLPGAVSQHLQFIALLGAMTLSVAFMPLRKPLSSSAIIGMGGFVFCIIMFASPLAAVQAVLKTKSAKAIPLPFTIASFLNCVFWVVYGIFDMQDFNIYVPNGLGLICTIVQIALKLIYGDGPEKDHIQLPM